MTTLGLKLGASETAKNELNEQRKQLEKQLADEHAGCDPSNSHSHRDADDHNRDAYRDRNTEKHTYREIQRETGRESF